MSSALDRRVGHPLVEHHRRRCSRIHNRLPWFRREHSRAAAPSLNRHRGLCYSPASPPIAPKGPQPWTQKTFDRAAEDLGNAIHLEHVNVTIPDQRIASLFYGAGLGLTRDPFLQVDDTNMWMNVGRSQFHLPTGKAQVLRGKTGIVIEGREDLLKRLANVKPKLADTKFDFAEANDYVQATCPWGNTIRLHEPDAARFGRINLGIPYVEFDVPVGTAKGIAKFYKRDDRRAGRRW